MIDLLIERGHVVLPGLTIKTNVGVKDGKIFSIGSSSEQAERRINAEGKIVMPGGIDPHTHFETTFMGETAKETWDKGTVAAAIGGTTMIIDHVFQDKGKSLMDKIKQRISRANKLSAVDFSVHGVFLDFTEPDKVMAEMKEIVNYGIPSFKEFMIYRKEGWYVDDWELLMVLKGAKEYGAIVDVHAENAFIGESWQQQCLKEGKIGLEYHSVAKPNFVEVEAIERCLSIAEFAGARVYIVHMSAKEGVEIVGNARKKGSPAYAETCPHYLMFTEDVFKTPRGVYYICSPPMRKKEDVEALWRGLADGRVSCVGSDHAAYTAEQKESHSATFADVPNGFPGVEALVPIIYSEGVGKGRLSLQRFVEVVSTNAAKVFGIYPRKGVIAPGSDADICIIDPKKKKSLNAADLHMGTDLSIYEGIELTGAPTMTIFRGKVIVEDEEYVRTLGEAEFVKGKIEDNLIRTV